MEVQNEIIKTKRRIDLLEHQNEKFKALLEKAVTVTGSTSMTSKSTVFEDEFLEESIGVIEEEREKLKDDLNCLVFEEELTDRSLAKKIESLERLRQIQQDQIETLKAEHAEIKFLLLHPESRNAEWLRNILELDNEVSESSNGSLLEERFRLQRKILNLEKKKAELLIAINDAAIPSNIGAFINIDLKKSMAEVLSSDEQLREYEELRFTMLNLEDERSRLLSDLQCVLDRSRKEIADEYNNLQGKIMEVERQKARLNLPNNLCEQKATIRELESIFSAFRNLPLKDTEHQRRMRKLKTGVGSVLGLDIKLPVYCNIL